MKCPLSQSPEFEPTECMKEECAWWLQTDHSDMCAIVVIAINTEGG